MKWRQWLLIGVLIGLLVWVWATDRAVAQLPDWPVLGFARLARAAVFGVTSGDWDRLLNLSSIPQARFKLRRYPFSGFSSAIERLF